MTDTQHTGTKDTMPRHHWMHDVLMAAGASVEQANPHRERLSLWYKSGEPVWMAADGLRQLVEASAAVRREESERVLIRRARLGLPLVRSER